MAEPKFVVGDTVVAKSGGPSMTVSGVVRGSNRYGYKTSWSAQDTERTGVFAEDMLEAPPQPEG